MEATFRCAACGAPVGAPAFPFRCPAAAPGDDLDHVLVRLAPPACPPSSEINPFSRYRGRLAAFDLARSHGLSDADYLDLLRRLDDAIADADGRGFVETPFEAQPDLAAALGFEASGSLRVKDETGNVSGSHKARHLMGIMLYLLVAERLGILTTRPELAIASCGNAALAAAVVARAARWSLRVFVPRAASSSVLDRLSCLGARIVICDRSPGRVGDPCYLAFREALGHGAIPFCCQGSDNGLTIEGGCTLAWDMSDRASLDAVFVQVGGGALASAVAAGLGACSPAALGAPRIYAVQTAGAFPLARAFDLLVARIVSRWPHDELAAESPGALADAIRRQPTLIDEAMQFARQHRSHFMWPWEQEPRSIAHGILDDETYDWAAVVEGMLRSGGRPIVVSEAQLRTANEIGRAGTGIDVDHTGSAGLAGLAALIGQELHLRRSRVAVIFSGVQRE